MHQALYRKWRPRTFDEVHGQEHITSILKYEVANGKFSHAYLFCGSRGTGKTSCAKILSKAVNCLEPKDGNPCCKCEACLAIDSGAATDVLEMDAASNNGVDNIRDIRDEVVYSPSNLKYRVYIIDEVHMLSASAFNALLKTLEEPPEHVVFILATTELHKLPATIISRCQRFDFRRITTDVLKNHLLRVAETEGIELDESAAILLAKQAQGGMRDAISLLDLCAGSREKIDDALVNRTVGSSGRGKMLEVVKAVAEKDYETLFAAVDSVVQSSRDITVFWQDLISVYRDLLIMKSSRNASLYLDLTDSETAEIGAIASLFTTETLSYHCSMLQDALLTMQKANSVRRITAELTLVRMCDEKLSNSPEAMLSRISSLERQAVMGGFVKESEVAEAKSERSEEKQSEPKITEEKSVRAKRQHRPVHALDDDDDMFRGDAPGVATKPESHTGSASVKQSHTKPEGNVRVLKPLRSRAEIIEGMDRISPMCSAFLSEAKWYTDENGRIILKFENQFGIDSVNRFGGPAIFARIASEVLGKNVSVADIVMEAVESRKESSIIDKILEAAETE